MQWNYTLLLGLVALASLCLNQFLQNLQQNSQNSQNSQEDEEGEEDEDAGGCLREQGKEEEKSWRDRDLAGRRKKNEENWRFLWKFEV